MWVNAKEKKGFIRVLEIVLFTFLVFGVLMSNFFQYRDSNDWESAKRLALSHDMLFAFESNKTFENVLAVEPYSYGPESYRTDLLNGTTQKVFPIVYDFEYEIKNVPPPRIVVGCLCNSSQLEWLKSILEPNKSLYMVVEPEPGNFSELFHTYVIFGDKNLEPYRKNITAALMNGTGFVLISDISSPPDNMTRELFGINYTGGPVQKANFRFDNTSGAVSAGISKRYIQAAKRIKTDGPGLTGKIHLKGQEYNVSQVPSGDCVNISSCPDCLAEGKSCLIPDVAKISLIRIDPSASRWIDIKISSASDNPRDYEFTDNAPLNVLRGAHTILYYEDKALANALIGAYSHSYETEPRRFWIYDYNKSDDDLNLLLKTGIIWSTGEHFFISRKDIPKKRMVATHFFTSLRNNSIPFTVKLYSWGY